MDDLSSLIKLDAKDLKKVSQQMGLAIAREQW